MGCPSTVHRLQETLQIYREDLVGCPSTVHRLQETLQISREDLVGMLTNCTLTTRNTSNLQGGSSDDVHVPANIHHMPHN